MHATEHRALRERIVSDHEVVSVQPSFELSSVDVTVTLDRGV